MFRMKAHATLAAIAAMAILVTPSIVQAQPVDAEAIGRPTASGPTEPKLTGSVQLLRLDDQDVRFTFDVRGFFTDAKGTFSFTHKAGDAVGWAKVKADCLITGGPVAVVTGFVTDTNVPELKGRRKGVSVYDGGRGGDRVGYSWPVTHDIDVPQCMSMAPFETVRSGDVRVQHWTPPLPTGTAQGQAAGAGTFSLR